MMYLFEWADAAGSKDKVEEDTARGRPQTDDELRASLAQNGIHTEAKFVENTPQQIFETSASDKPDDQGLLYKFNDTFLEVRCWNADRRGFATMGAIGYTVLFCKLFYLVWHGLFLREDRLFVWGAAALFVTAMGAIVFYTLHRFLFTFELFTLRRIRLRFNRKTQRVYILRPRFAGGFYTYPWRHTTPGTNLDGPPEAGGHGNLLMTWRRCKEGVEGSRIDCGQFIGYRKSFMTGAQERAFWEYLRLYMEVGPQAVPAPKHLISAWPNPMESIRSVSQWTLNAYIIPPVPGEDPAGRSFHQFIQFLLLPITVIWIGFNFAGQLLTWEGRFPKAIERAGRDD